MATALVTGPVERRPADAGGLELVYEVSFGLDNRTVDLDVLTIVVAAGDTGNVISARLSTAVQNLAVSRGYAVARSAITLPAYTKG